jgi:hypothetical protein
MDEIIPTINMVVYLIANALEPKEGRRKQHYYLGGHGYTYDVKEEGKKKLAKDVATSTGYYTGNKQKPNTVVVVQDIVSLTVPNGHSLIDSLMKGFLEVLKVANERKQKNLWIITPHKELELISKLQEPAWKVITGQEVKVGKHILTPEEVKTGLAIYEQLEILKADKERKLFFDLAGSAEGGLGNRLAHKQMEIAEIASVWGHEEKPDVSVMSRKDYENPESDFNKMVDATRWYFETGNRSKFYDLLHGYRVYNFGKVEPDKNYYGKITPDVTYSKLYSLEPITLLDKMYEFTAKKIANPDGYLSAGTLNNLTGKDVARMLDGIPAVKENNNLVSPVTKGNGKPVLIELISPVLMSYRIREFLDTMDIVLESFLKKDDNNVFGATKFYDITDQIFVKEANTKGVVKLKLHPEFNQLKTAFKIPVEHRNAVKPVPIMLSIGYDIPTRNSFNSVEDPDVEVWVAVDSRNEQGMRYCTLVKTKDFIYVQTAAGANLRVLSEAELGRKS